MILRIWHTGVDPERWGDYAEFEKTHSAPMFHQQPGCLGVFFLRNGTDRAAVCTLWADQASVDLLAGSETYQTNVRRLLGTGILCDEQWVELMPIAHGWLEAEAVRAALEAEAAAETPS